MKAQLQVITQSEGHVNICMLEIPKEFLRGVDPGKLGRALTHLYGLMPNVEVVSVSKMEAVPHEIVMEHEDSEDLIEAKAALRKFTVR